MASVQHEETVLQILPTDSQTERVAVCLVRGSASPGTRIRLREESYSTHVGWYTQGHIDLSAEQIQALRSVLGPVASEAMPATRPIRAIASAAPGCEDDAPATIKLSANRAG